MRCFVALPLPGQYQDGLEGLVRELGVGLDSKISWTKPGTWHLTLKFLGDVEEGHLDAVRQALTGAAFAPFALQAGGGGFFPDMRRPRVLWAGLRTGESRARGLAALVDTALAGVGFLPEKREFRPHLTIGRIKKPARDDWKSVLARVQGWQWPEIMASHCVLYQSVLGPEGPAYTRLHAFAANKGQ